MQSSSRHDTLLLVNGQIYTGPPWTDPTEAIAIEDGYVTAQGDRALSMRQNFSPEYILDVDGAMVLPGFIDSHLHLTALADSLNELEFPEDSDEEEIRARVAETVRNRDSGEWIIGGKWSYHTLNGFPEKTMLDGVAPANPVALRSKDMHSLLLNSAGLTSLGITGDTPDPEGGRIRRDAQGNPTGILQEQAVYLFEERRPHSEFSVFRRHHRQVAEHCLKYGITGVHTIETVREWTQYQRIRESGGLRLRVGGLLQADEPEAIPEAGYASGAGDNWLWTIGIKLFADGALGSGTAWLKEPYEGTGDRGVAILTREQLRNLITFAHENGLSLGVHAIGDAAVAMVIRGFSEYDSRRREELRDRIEHLQLIDPGDLRNIPGDLIAAVQPVHLLGDREPADQVWGERARYAYAFQSLSENGVRLAFGSDAPVEEVNPWAGIQAAVERRGNADETPWYPQERISLEAALAGYTVNSAFAGYRDGVLGTLEPGAAGDVIVLNRDPWEIPSTELHTIHPAITICNGAVVYSDA